MIPGNLLDSTDSKNHKAYTLAVYNYIEFSVTLFLTFQWYDLIVGKPKLSKLS